MKPPVLELDLRSARARARAPPVVGTEVADPAGALLVRFTGLRSCDLDGLLQNLVQAIASQTAMQFVEASARPSVLVSGQLYEMV